MKRKLLFLWCVLAISYYPIYSQVIEHVRFHQQEDNIVINYKLIEEESSHSPSGGYNIKVFYILNKHEPVQLNSVSGDAGNGVLPGKNKEIVWDVLADMDKLEGDIKFIVKIEKKTNFLDYYKHKHNFLFGARFMLFYSNEFFPGAMAGYMYNQRIGGYLTFNTNIDYSYYSITGCVLFNPLRFNFNNGETFYTNINLGGGFDDIDDYHLNFGIMFNYKFIYLSGGIEIPLCIGEIQGLTEVFGLGIVF